MLIVNFGGPREPEEVFPFLEELLCDRDVVATPYPAFFHNWLFRKIAKKRSARARADYEKIGGASPIYYDTEEIACRLSKKTGLKALSFHRYLPKTHAASLQSIAAFKGSEIPVLPLFPQFTYATTGSIARFFAKNLSPQTVERLRWIPSYCDHPLFIQCWQKHILNFINDLHLTHPILFFTAHGIPLSFVKQGDPYQRQCERTFKALKALFPNNHCILAYQSKFGPGEWLQPYTDQLCEKALDWNPKKIPVVLIPLSFTSDHIETLFEIEYLYLPPLRKEGIEAYRCPGINQAPDWIDALAEILKTERKVPNHFLIKKP